MTRIGKIGKMDTGDKTIRGIIKTNQGTLTKEVDSPPQTREIKDTSI